MYKIIENFSPYYIRFKHQGIEEVIQFAKEKLKTFDLNGELSVFQRKLNLEDSKKFLNLLPYKDKFEFQKDRIAFIITKPNTRHNVHIDKGSISINYGIEIKDNLCKTNFYESNSIENSYPLGAFNWNDNNNKVLLDEKEFDKSPVSPVKSFTQREGECILFNTDIYHDFNNSSPNKRIILTLRASPPDRYNFYQSRKMLFGF